MGSSLVPCRRPVVAAVIGYYVHHQGSGHLHRARAIADALADEVTILSSVPRPPDWAGAWVALPLDTDVPPVDRDAGGAFHWAPVGSAGLAGRMSLITEWIAAARPRVVVVDVSVEVACLVRLAGVRVVVVAQPGRRDDDAHTLGYRVADAVIGCWPPSVDPVIVREPQRVEAVGGLSRLAVRSDVERSGTICVLTGTGGRGPSALDAAVEDARRSMPELEWVTLSGQTADEVEQALRTSAVVFGHCGANVVAEIAASRVPAVLVPEERPFGEQRHLASALAAADLPVHVVSSGGSVDWRAVLAKLRADDGTRWETWVDGGAAHRAAAVIERVAATVGSA